MMVGMASRFEVGLFHHERRLAEGRGPQREICPDRKSFRRSAEGGHGHDAGRYLLRGGVEGVVPLPQKGAFQGFKILDRKSTRLNSSH